MSQETVYLEHIRDAIGKIDQYVAIGQERFFAESHW